MEQTRKLYVDETVTLVNESNDDDDSDDDNPSENRSSDDVWIQSGFSREWQNRPPVIQK